MVKIFATLFKIIAALLYLQSSITLLVAMLNVFVSIFICCRLSGERDLANPIYDSNSCCNTAASEMPISSSRSVGAQNVHDHGNNIYANYSEIEVDISKCGGMPMVSSFKRKTQETESGLKYSALIKEYEDAKHFNT